jgi:SAM-dependent methyltransferase
VEGIERLREHRALWAGKPILARVYAPWFAALAEAVGPARRVLEVGAGPGLLAAWARERASASRWVAVDVLPAPWNDVAGDAHRLPFGREAFDAIVTLDVVHHLAEPGRFFAECARVLGRHGRLASVEPWISPLSYPIYRWLHHEGCRPGLDPWRPFAGGKAKRPFEGDGGVLSRLVRTTPAARWREIGLSPPRLRLFNGFAYLLSLGFRRASLLPRGAAPALMAFDRWLQPGAPLLAMRALAVWERAGG